MSQDFKGVDAEFVSTLKEKGNDFMLKAAVSRPEVFRFCIDGGWAQSRRGHWLEKSFLCSLPNIEDPRIAVDALRQVLKDATPAQVNEAIFGKSNSESNAARSWFSRYGRTEVGAKAWRHAVFKEAIAMGLDVLTEFPHSTNLIPSARYTLLGTFIADAHGQWNSSDHVGSFAKWSEPVNEVLDLGATLDKNSLVVLLKNHNQEALPLWISLFEERGLLNATEALKSVSRFKIDPAKLAQLQSKAALEAIDLAIPKISKNQTLP